MTRRNKSLSFGGSMINRISLIGLGNLGKTHLRHLLESHVWVLAGIYDQNTTVCRDLSQQYGVKAFASLEDAFQNADVIALATPGSTHVDLVQKAVVAGKHVFVEQLVTSDIKEARQLQKLVSEAGVVLQVGRTERLNPAFKAALPFLHEPVFMEVHRLSSYKPSGTDVSVVMDQMIHDLDLILSLVKSNVKKIHASGTALVSEKADIVNARIEFENGAVANVTANRMAFKQKRKFRVFTRNNFVSVNLLDKTTEIIRLQNAKAGSTNRVLETRGNRPKKEIVFEHPIILPTNAINEQFGALHVNVNATKVKIAGIEDTIRALEVAFEIEEKLAY